MIETKPIQNGKELLQLNKIYEVFTKMIQKNLLALILTKNGNISNNLRLKSVLLKYK